MNDSKYPNLKKSLQVLLEEARNKRKAEDDARNLKNEEDRKVIYEKLGSDLGGVMTPFIEKLKENSNLSAQELKRIIGETIKMPEVKTDGIQKALSDSFSMFSKSFKIPTPVVNYQAPSIKIPEIKVPAINMPDVMKVLIGGVDKKNPLPVLLMGLDGKPFMFSQGLGGGMSGGKADFFTIKDILATIGVVTINPDGTPTYTTSSAGGSGSSTVSLVNADGNYYNSDNPLPITGSISVSPSAQVSGAVDSVNIVQTITLPVSQVSGAEFSVVVNQIFGSTSTNLVNPDGRLKVELPTGSSSLTDTELRASAVPVSQVSGVAFSVVVNEIFGSTATNLVDPDGRLKVVLDQSIGGGTQYAEGAVGSTFTGNMTMFAEASTDSVVAVSSVNPFPTDLATRLDAINDSITTYFAAESVASTNIVAQALGIEVKQVSGFVDSVNIVSSVTQDVRQLSGAIDSMFMTGAADSFAVYEVMTTNKTVKSDGADIRAKTDDLGRQVMRNIQVRDLIATAYVSLTGGAETTLKAGVAGAFLDLIYILGANDSDGAVRVDIRAVTGGNIVTSIVVPPYGTAGVSLPVPIPQDATGNNWTADMPDISGTTVTLSALFSQEI